MRKTETTCPTPRYGLSRALEGDIPKPAGAGPWGCDETDAKYIARGDLCDTARRLCTWLVKDMDLQIKKHVGDMH